jgi:hypothetical protein
MAESRRCPTCKSHTDDFSPGAGYCRPCAAALKRKRRAAGLEVDTRIDRHAYKPAYWQQYYRENREKVLARNREWQRNNPEKAESVRRNTYLKRTYGITLSDYQALLEAQGSACAICGGQDPHGRSLAVDHCHDTGRVRGLLCDPCNRCVGLLGDRSDVAKAMSRYLEGGSQ